MKAGCNFWWRESAYGGDIIICNFQLSMSFARNYVLLNFVHQIKKQSDSYLRINAAREALLSNSSSINRLFLALYHIIGCVLLYQISKRYAVAKLELEKIVFHFTLKGVV